MKSVFLSVFFSLVLTIGYAQLATLDHQIVLLPSHGVSLQNASNGFAVSDSITSKVQIKFNDLSQVDTLRLIQKDTSNQILNQFDISLISQSGDLTFQQRANTIYITQPPAYFSTIQRFTIEAILSNRSSLQFNLD